MADYTQDPTGEPMATNGTNGHGLRASTASRFREEGAQLAETARDSAMRAADARKSQAAGVAHDLSSALQKGSEHLQERGREGLAHYFDLAAGAAEQFGSDLERKDIGELMDTVADFARRRPTLLFGAALVVGFGLARFAMSGRGADDMSGGDYSSGALDTTGPVDTLSGPGTSQAATGAPSMSRPSSSTASTYESPGAQTYPMGSNPKSEEKP